MTSRILELAAIISSSTATIQNYLACRGLHFPSFEPHATDPLPEELAEAQDAVLDATAELHDLLMPPINALHTNGNAQNLVSLNAVCRFDFANSFAPEDEATFAHIAQYAGLGESVTKSLLHHAMTMRIFHEPRKGVVAHTARSMLLREKRILNFIGTGMKEMNSAALQTVNALSKWPNSEEPTQTGFVLANNNGLPLYEVLRDDAARAKRFADVMDIFTSEKGFETSHVIAGFDWQSLGDAVVVDLGGSHGHISIAIAGEFPLLKFIVQDLESTINGVTHELTDGLSGRVSFMAHDFFREQPIVADVYYFRWIFHNWSDKYCVKILQALIPALRPGARIIINDTCVAEPGKIAFWREKELRTFDLGMIALLNGRERDADEWRLLFDRADSRFHLVGVKQPEGSSLAMMEAVWKG